MAASAVFLFAVVLAEQFAPLVGLFRSAEAQQQTGLLVLGGTVFAAAYRPGDAVT